MAKRNGNRRAQRGSPRGTPERLLPGGYLARRRCRRPSAGRGSSAHRRSASAAAPARRTSRPPGAGTAGLSHGPRPPRGTKAIRHQRPPPLSAWSCPAWSCPTNGPKHPGPGIFCHTCTARSRAGWSISSNCPTVFSHTMNFPKDSIVPVLLNLVQKLPVPTELLVLCPCVFIRSIF